MSLRAHAAQVGDENPALVAQGNAKAGMLAGKVPTLLAQGKRRAMVDVSNTANQQAAARAIPGKAEALKPRAALKPAPVQAPAAAAAPKVSSAPAAVDAPLCVAPRTRSQTGALKAKAAAAAPVGSSFSNMIESRSAAAGRRSGGGSLAMAVAPPSPLPDIDSLDRMNPLMASDYVNDIYSYYKRAEPKYRVPDNYMSRQANINEKMRGILVDWLVEVHLKFKLMSETLFLTVNLIDRFLDLKQVTTRNLQLVGVTAMLIGSKYEEIWAPEVRDFVYISDKAYTREQILGMEKLMLNTLRFNLTVPTQYNFMARFLKAAGVCMDKQITLLSSYIGELSLPDYGMLQHSYSLISAAAVYVAMRAVGRGDPYPHSLARHSGYSLEVVRPVAAQLVQLMSKASTNSLTAVHKKYSGPKYCEVAKIAPPLSILAEAGIQ